MFDWYILNSSADNRVCLSCGLTFYIASVTILAQAASVSQPLGLNLRISPSFPADAKTMTMASTRCIITAILLCGNLQPGTSVQRGNPFAWVHLPSLPEAPLPIIVSNETACTYTLPDVVNAHVLFPEGHYFNQYNEGLGQPVRPLVPIRHLVPSGRKRGPSAAIAKKSKPTARDYNIQSPHDVSYPGG